MIAAFEIDYRGPVWCGVNSETGTSAHTKPVIIDNGVPNNYGTWKPKQIRNPDWFKLAMHRMGWRPFVRSRR